MIYYRLKRKADGEFFVSKDQLSEPAPGTDSGSAFKAYPNRDGPINAMVRNGLSPSDWLIEEITVDIVDVFGLGLARLYETKAGL